MERAFKFKSVAEDKAKFSECDLIISPKSLNKYKTFDKKYLNQIFNIGYNAALKALADNKTFVQTIIENWWLSL